MKVTVIGARGRIGSTMVRMAEKAGHEILHELNREDAVTLEKLKRSDISILAVPMEAASSIIEEFGAECSLMELSSVKSAMKVYSGKVISTHPLFGPASFSNPDFNTVLYISDISPEGTMGTVSELFPENRIVSVTAEEHDRAMASLLVAPYVVSMIAKRLASTDIGFATPSFANLKRIASVLDGENTAVVRDTIGKNEFTESILEAIGKELSEIRSGLN